MAQSEIKDILVLEEVEYLSKLERVIQRDFFPELFLLESIRQG